MATKTNISNLFESLEQNLSVDTFSARKQLQKLVYLSEVFGIEMGFKFHWYIHGPYSPRLTRVMFDKEKGRSIKIKDQSNFESKISELKSFLGDDISHSDKLELIASVHYVSSLAKDPVKEKTDILNIIYDEKPQFSKMEVERCYERVMIFFNRSYVQSSKSAQ